MKRKLKFKNIIIVLTLIFVGVLILTNLPKDKKSEINKMTNLENKNISEVEKYSKDNNLELEIKYEYNETIEKDKVINQSIKKDTKLNKNDKLIVTISKGKIDETVYKEYGVNELGNVPIMMYHKIIDMPSSETKYVGGNVDVDGYNRTSEAFRNDLEFYYNEGYRMVRLIDYVNGDINTELGKSPLILTFDDGDKTNFNVLGRNEDGSLKIDPNCAVGILEEFKKKYPDFNVTATFFVMSGLFGQDEYNEEILKWLVDNGYDVGNHTKNHVNFRSATSTQSQNEVGYMYELLESIIPGKYVNIIALPYGSPGDKGHSNFKYTLSGSYNGKEYNTISTLRVGWMSEVSPFNKNFDKTFLKRIRAYDNNGKEFDITASFESLKSNKYISDGNKNTVVIPSDKEASLGTTDKTIIKY